MFQGLQESQLAGAIEAMLFVTDEPVGVITLADMLEVDPAQVEAALVELRDKLAAEERGVQLREVAGGWRLFTHPVYHELIEKYVISWDTRRLSQAALETLAVVAYSQPVTRGQVAAVRGVNSDSSINSLVEKGLLSEAGTADAIAEVLRKYHLPVSDDASLDEVLRATALDKKGLGGDLRIVLLRAVGESFVHRLPRAEFAALCREALAEEAR